METNKKKNIHLAIGVLLICAIAAGGYLFWRNSLPPEPAPLSAERATVAQIKTFTEETKVDNGYHYAYNWKEVLQQELCDISEVEYQALAEYYLSECDDKEHQEEFLNALLTTRDGKALIDKESEILLANVTQAAESQYAGEEAAMVHAYDTNDDECGKLWEMYDKHYQNLALIQICTAVTEKRMNEQGGKYINYKNGTVIPQVVNDFHISLGDGFTETQNEFGKPDGYKVTAVFTEGDVTVCTATIYDYSNYGSLSKKLQNEFANYVDDFADDSPIISMLTKKSDDLIPKVMTSTWSLAMYPFSVVIDIYQTYEETREQYDLEMRMINLNNASHACKKFAATGLYIEVTTDNVFHWPWEREQKDYYIQPRWNLHQSELSNKFIEDYNNETGAEFNSFDEAMDHALSKGAD